MDRNLESTDGVKLWNSGVAVSPNSFKTHLARINAFYRPGLDTYSLEECVAEAKKSAAIVVDLPPAQSTAKPLATIGSLYKLIKGRYFLTRQQTTAPSFGSLMASAPSESSQQWYEKALETLSQAAALDRIQSAAPRQRQLSQGVPKNRIREGGRSFLYSHLGDTYRLLGRFPEALEAFRHLSAIAPTDAAVYRQIAQMENAMGLREEAIRALWQAQSLRPSEANQLDLVSVYRELDATAVRLTTAGSMKD